MPKKAFERDFDLGTRRNPAFAERVNRRIAKLAENPRHHGYHAGGLLRCHWIAGVGDRVIVYDIQERNRRVVLLRILSLNEV